VSHSSSYKLELTSKEGGPSFGQFCLEFFQMFQDILDVIVHRQVILVVKGLRGGANDLSGERKVSNLLGITLCRYFTGACFDLLKRTQKYIRPFDTSVHWGRWRVWKYEPKKYVASIFELYPWRAYFVNRYCFDIQASVIRILWYLLCFRNDQGILVLKSKVKAFYRFESKTWMPNSLLFTAETRILSFQFHKFIFYCAYHVVA
jgi:hypothetical protein